MAKKILKTRTQYTSTLRNDLYADLKKTSERTGIPMSRLLDWAVEALFEGKDLEVRRKQRF